jgi:hypothetical protein
MPSLVMPIAGMSPGRAAVQFDLALVNVLLTGLHTTFLTTRGPPGPRSARPIGLMFANERTGTSANQSRHF